MKTPRALPVLTFALVLACTTGATPPTGETVTLPQIEFPMVLLHHGVTAGKVHLFVKISPEARLLDALVTAYTHKPFADATLEALPRSTFRPLRVDGQPVVTVAELVVRFEVSGLFFIERYSSGPDSLRPGTYAYEPCDPARLDHPLQPVAIRSPDYPEELSKQGIQGSVVLEYYIDETGRVRIPRVSEAGHETLANLSLAAVEQWQFQPPSSQNKPVLVRVRQQFDFVPKTPG